MGFLIKRGTALAQAGWSDDFDRPNENPVKAPWNFWGNVANFALVNNRLKLAADGAPARGGNYDGGVAFEHQPLTKNWAFEFTRAPIGNTGRSRANETRQSIFLDRNWTEGGNASSTMYQVALELESVYSAEEKDSEGKVTQQERMDYLIHIRTRDKNIVNTTWLWTTYGSIGGDTESIAASEWASAMKVRVHVFADRYIIAYVNGKQKLFADMYDLNFRFGPRKRSANFAQVSGLVASIDNFKTYDLPFNSMREVWAERFYDSFNRAGSNTVGNGWTQRSGGGFGIQDNGLSMRSAFSGDDGFHQIARDTGSTDMKVEFVLGGDGIGEPNSNAKSAVLGRMSPDGRSGLMAYIGEQTIWLGGFGWGGTRAGPQFLPNAPWFFSNPLVSRLEEGIRYSLVVSGDAMWLINETKNGQVIQYREGVNAIQPQSPNNTWAGAFISRLAFVNSVSIGEIRIHT